MTKAALPHLKKGGGDHQHHVGHRLQGQPDAAGLLLHQGRDRRLHPLAGAAAGRTGASASTRVAPGPIWTPLIPASFDAEKVAKHGAGAPMKRPGQPDEVAPCYVFLASSDASYMTGQVLHPNGGTVVGG